MKKIVSLALVCVLMLGVMFTLASCGSNISQSYADKINDAEEKLTYEQVLKDLGDAAIDMTVDIPLAGHSGTIVAVEGINAADYKGLSAKDAATKLQEDMAKLEEKGEVEAITIFIAGDKATSATYGKSTDK